MTDKNVSPLIMHLREKTGCLKLNNIMLLINERTLHSILLILCFLSSVTLSLCLPCFQKDEKEAPEAYIVQRYIEDPYLIGSKFLL